MVKKSTIAALAGIGILAAVFLGRPKVVKTVQEPIPFEVPRPVPQPVPIPFLNLDIAKDFLESEFGELYTKTKQRVETTRQNPEYKARFYGSGSDIRIRQDLERWLKTNRTYETITKYNPI